MGKKIKDVTRLLIGSEQTAFEISEAYKACRTNITACLAAKKHKVVIISSAMPEEGKSLTCANLAISFAMKGERVLLIDANLRNPGQQKFFEYSAPFYLVDVLQGRCEVEKAISPSQYENLSTMQVGTIPTDSTELIGSKQMKDLLEFTSESYTYVFIDSAPINVVTDTIVLTSFVPDVFLVARQRKTKNKDFNEALDRLSFVNAKVIGVIMNDIKVEKSNKIKGKGYGIKQKRGSK